MIDGFLNYLRYERNYSELTVEGYGKDLEDFQAYFKSLDEGLEWGSVDADVVRGWMEHMMDKGNAATSVNRRLSAVRTFYKYAMRTGLAKSDPAHAVKGPKKNHPLPKFVREKEMDMALDSETGGEQYKNVRARTLLLMFYTTGMRLSELIALDDANIDMEAGELRVTGKRDKQRIIPFGQELRETLLQYMECRDAGVARQCEAFFVTAKGERMNRNQVRYEVEKSLKGWTTIPQRTPHVLRHSFATAMLNHGAGLESVKKLLGHESLTTTEVYTHATFEQLKRIYNSAHPRA